ncbi:MAG: hypothetical protein ACC645_05115 [Pirellulales bacterium]
MTARNAILSIAIAVTAGLAHAADYEILQQSYGRGVHAYFAGNNAVAGQELSRAIDGGSRDPRAYYFRGLTYLNMGRRDEAHADMAHGGRLETLDVDGVYPVSRSLERVQGASRQLLERYRRQATMAAFQREQKRQLRRYETIRRREPQVLRQQVDLRLDRFARPVSQHAISHDVPAVVPEPDRDRVDTGTATPAHSHASKPGQHRDPFDDDNRPDTKPVPKKSMAPGTFGRVLGRVLGKSLPTDEPAGAQTKETKENRLLAEEDPFAEGASPSTDDSVTETPALPADVKSGEAIPPDPFGDDEPASADPSPPAAEKENPAEASSGEEAAAVEGAPFDNEDSAAGPDEDDPFGDN